MLTKKERHAEFWMLVKGVLQDSKVDADEAQVIKRWLEEHQQGDEFAFAIKSLGEQLADRYIDRYESQRICEALGDVLRRLRTEANAEA
ncbi:MAG: hypothetical protein MJ240_06855 [Kiritimatiellae bacterium]|nr:hypothetical protein [Kiritimatiellia bacterium]